MARYFFHTANHGRERDEQGFELADDDAARIEAIRFAGSMMADQPKVLWDGKDFRVEVTNEPGDLLFTIIMLAIDAPRFRQG